MEPFWYVASAAAIAERLDVYAALADEDLPGPPNSANRPSRPHDLTEEQVDDLDRRVSAQYERWRLVEGQRDAIVDAERVAWIAANGSPRLQKGHAAGYDVTGLYLHERAAHEHPGAVLDYHDKADFRERVSPSEAALDLAAEKGGRVVWLTSPPRPWPVTKEAYIDRLHPYTHGGIEAVAVPWQDDSTVYYLLGDPA